MKRAVLLISTLCFIAKTNAQKPPVPVQPSAKTPLLFIENKGQWNQEARYKAALPNGAVFITDNGFVYNFASRDDLNRIHDIYESNKGIDVDNEIVRHYAYKVNFDGCNTGKAVYESGLKSKTHFNYFIGNDQSHWAGNVGLYGNVIHKNIYNGIDVSISSLNETVKYDFLVVPNADANQIALSFEGVKPVITAKGELKIVTPINEIIEKAPYTYQEIDGQRVAVKTQYQWSNGKLVFAFPQGYNKNYALVIDPELTFATYSGGNSASNYSFATTFDKTGHLYAGAQAYGVGWPVSSGAWQGTFSGDVDVAINKYSPDGLTLIYSTYYGGSSTDLPHAMMANDQQELIVVGTTTSSNLATTTGCYDATFNGGRDIFVTHFNLDGSALLGATYIGSNGTTEPSTFSLTGSSTAVSGQNTTSPLELNIDANGDIWVVTNTTSNAFPVTSNALQSTSAGGMDVILFKMNNTCSNLLYSTYLGGSGDDAGFGVKFQSSGNVVICGATKSTNFPTTSGVLHATALGGTFDGFASIISPAGTLLNSTYLGTSGTDQAVNLDIDCADDIYVLGRTDGNYPVSSGVYSMAGTDMFIDKLSPTLSASLLSTRLGYNINGGSQCFPTGFVLDICGNVYISTLTQYGSSSYVVPGMPLSPDAFSTTPDNFYFIALEAGFNDLLFATYFGLQNVDDHTHVGVNRMDKSGVVYHSICCAGSGWPTSPANVYAPNKLNAAGQDIISFKFNFDAVNIDLTKQSSGGGDDTATHCIRGCKSAFINFERAGKLDSALTIHYLISGDASNGYDYQHIADSIVIAPNQSSNVLEIKPLLIPNPTGVKEVIIQALSPCGCEDGSSNVVREARVKIYDSLFVEITTPPITVCPRTPITIEAKIDTSLRFHWSPINFDQGSLIINPIPSATKVYSITATQPGAPATCPPRTISYTVTVETIPQISFEKKNITICLNPTDSLNINAYILPLGVNYDYQWSPAAYLRNDHDLSNLFSAPIGDYRKVLTVSTPIAHCTNKDSIMIHVMPPFAFTGIYPSRDTTIRYGDSLRLNVLGDAVLWYWSPVSYPEDAFAQSPVVHPLQNTLYTVVGFGEFGCTDTATVKVNVDFNSNAGLPNAFSPNGDGLNDEFKIENRRFEKLNEFRIFNRNGQCVYDGMDPEKGWDGTFNKKPCDVGTYYYIVRVVFPDATQKTFKGSVTLLR
jgi:gliding motility-associated-like protein